jgi:hypothetical protein
MRTLQTIIVAWLICDLLFALFWAWLFELGREHSAFVSQTRSRKTLKLDRSWYTRSHRFA